jgi:hypothetical protein
MIKYIEPSQYRRDNNVAAGLAQIQHEIETRANRREWLRRARNARARGETKLADHLVQHAAIACRIGPLRPQTDWGAAHHQRPQWPNAR